MFENLIKEVNRLNGQSISVPIELDEKGYIDKQCPSEECEFIFKVHEEDWKDIFIDEAVFCPLCRHEAPSDQWFTIEQVEHAKSEALKVISGRMHNAMRSDAQRFNCGQPKKSFISVSLKGPNGHKRTYILPARAAEKMQLEIQCEICKSRFSVIGCAYFCPACGHNSVTQTFSDSLRKINAKVDNTSIVRRAMTESVGRDEAELICRSLIETSISDGVVAFQKLCEGLFEPFGKAPFNAFQRLDQANELWEQKIGVGFSSWVNEPEYQNLKILYQKRHLLAHNEGIVDEQYLRKSGDDSYNIGQRIVITKADVTLLISCLQKLSKGLQTSCKSA